MLVDHVTFSKTGGAGEVASLLVKAQNEVGSDAELISLIDKDLKAEPLRVPSITAAAALDEILVSNHSSPTIISLFRSSLNKVHANDLRDKAIVHLHWVSGLIDHKQIKYLLDSGRKVVWTLHDMAPFTGTCHHSYGCSEFERTCSNCPQVRSPFRSVVKLKLDQKIFQEPHKNLILVAPTSWMAGQAQKSVAFRNQRIEIIENPIREEFFLDSESAYLGRESHSPAGTEALVLAAVASDLRNPAKGIQMLVDVFRQLRQLDSRIKLNLMGRRGEIFHHPEAGVVWHGSVSVAKLIEIARQSNLLVSASSAESAGLTVREFGSLNVPSIAIQSGGIENLIEDGISGLLVANAEELREKLSEILRGQISLSKLGIKARELATQNKPAITAQKYLELYKSLS